MENSFSFNEPAFTITKSYRDDSGKMFVEGLASTINIDATGEKMAPEAIAKMAARLIGKPLRDEHEKGWYDKLGEIIQADVIKDEGGKPALWIKAKLFDWSSKAKDLFQLLVGGGKMGLSVAGKINPGGIVRQFVESVGKYIPTYIDVEPTEVSVTDHPANLDTFAYAVAKSMNKKEASDKEEIKKVIPVITDTNGKGVNNMKKTNTNLVSKQNVPSDVLTFVKDYNPTMAASISEGLKKVEKKVPEEKVVEKAVDVKTETATTTPTETAKAEVKTEGTEVKKEEVKAEAAVEKAEEKKPEVATATTTTPTETVKSSTTDTTTSGGDSGSSLEAILSDLASTLNNLKTGLSSADSSTGTGSDTKTGTGTETDTDTGSGMDEEEVGKAMGMMEEALKNLKMCMGKAKKTDSQPSSTTTPTTEVVTEKAKETTTTTPTAMAPGSDYSTEKSETVKALERLQKTIEGLVETRKADEAKKSQEEIVALKKSLSELSEKVEKIPNMRKGVAMVVEKNLGGKEEEAKVEKSQADFVNPFEAGRKTAMYQKMINDSDISFTDVQKYLTAGIIPAKYQKLQGKDEMNKNILNDKTVSFKDAQRYFNGGTLPTQYAKKEDVKAE